MRTDLFIRHSNSNPFLIFMFNKKDKVVSKEHKLRFDEFGLRHKTNITITKPKDIIRIMALGDSVTANQKYDFDYCSISEERTHNTYFTNENKRLQFINAGQEGYSTAHSLIRLQFDLLKFRPDIISLMHNITDLTVNYFPDNKYLNYSNKYLNDYFAPSVFSIKNIKMNIFDYLPRLLKTYKIYYNLRKKIKPHNQKYLNNMVFSNKRNDLKYLEFFENNLSSFISICKANNIKPLLITSPYCFEEDLVLKSIGFKSFNKVCTYPELRLFKDDYVSYNKSIIKVSRKNKCDYIDMSRYLSEKKELFDDFVHLNQKGLELFSEVYVKKIKELIKSE